MAVVSSSSTTHLLRQFLRRPQQPHLPLLSLTPLSSSSSTKAVLSKHNKTPFLKSNHIHFFYRSLSSSSPNSTKSLDHSRSLQALELEEDFRDIHSVSDAEFESEFDSERDEIESENLEFEAKNTDGFGGFNDNSSKQGLRTNGIVKVPDFHGIHGQSDTELDSESENLEFEGKISDGIGVVSDKSSKEGLRTSEVVKVPNLTVKEKKELASYAHGLGKKLKSQLVGKSGVTENVISSFIETLEANELLKIKIHRTCPGVLEDVVQHLEEATGSVVVSQIGRTVIIYRPSLTKLKMEEKKKQNRRIYVRSESKLNPMSWLRNKPREQTQRLSGRGRRGSSRTVGA